MNSYLFNPSVEKHLLTDLQRKADYSHFCAFIDNIGLINSLTKHGDINLEQDHMFVHHDNTIVRLDYYLVKDASWVKDFKTVNNTKVSTQLCTIMLILDLSVDGKGTKANTKPKIFPAPIRFDKTDPVKVKQFHNAKKK